jgi:hypothetical protein
MTEPFALTPLGLGQELSLDGVLDPVTPYAGQPGDDDSGTGHAAGTGPGEVPRRYENVAAGAGTGDGTGTASTGGTGTSDLLPAVPAGRGRGPVGGQAGIIGAHWTGLFIGAAARRFRNRNSVYHSMLVAPPEAWFAHLLRVIRHHWIPEGYEGIWLYPAGYAIEIPCLILHGIGSILIQLSRPWRVLALIALITVFTVRACTG